MARRKQVEEKPTLNPEIFKVAIEEIAKEKGVSRETVILALKEAFEKAYARHLAADDADIHVDITDDPVSIDIYVMKDVIDDEEDDENAYEIPLTSAKKYDADAKIGDKVKVGIDIKEFTTMTASVIKGVLKQKLNDAEKVALYDEYKDKIGEMITGEVKSTEDRGCHINFGRTSIFLPRKEMIGNEHYENGDQIRVYIADVTSNEKGPQIKISRSDPGFIRRLFEEEVFDIYDGTVIIKDVARNAGIRTKLSVYSNDPNVDPIGSCIGVNGSAIQKINAQLGNGSEKEKIDIIPYSKNPALYVMDALRPATVSKIFIDEDNKEAICIVPDGQLSLAIGRKGANARVASQLTGYTLIIKEENQQAEVEEERGITFLDPEEVKKEEANRVKKENYEKYLASIKAKQAEEASAVSTSAVEKNKPINITDEMVKEEPVIETPSEVAPAAVEFVTPVVDSFVEKQPEPEVEAPAPKAEEKAEAPARSINVKTTTTLESLEKELEEEKKKDSFKATKKDSKRPRKITEEEQPHEASKIDPLKNSMPIYSEEELEEIEALENEDDDLYDDDYDYDDFDSYYDDDK